ncbi:MAG TPA: ethylbenzene dehydrogenase-related protein [Anaerolineales bacterium]|nr:ethylbenzene dehydrogenase-related protein [Anaerolineales bacterium]
MSKRHLLLPGLLLMLAAVLTFLKVPLASSQGLTLVAAEVSGELPMTDPEAAVWQEATAIEAPLSAQNVARPMILNTQVRSVTARALHNGSQIALLVEWADDTQSDEMVRVQDFRDAVAVQFPLAEGQPFFCMGQPGGNVNIWHWKADWQADIAARRDVNTAYANMYVDQYPFVGIGEALLASPADYTDPNYLPALASGNLFASATYASPVEDLIAGGFGSLTSQPVAGQNVQGYGVWSDGRWRVIFSRDLKSQDADDVNLSTGKVYSLAFAAWDGANGERNGQKSTSQWVSLQLEGMIPTGPAPQPAQRAAAPLDWLGMAFVFGPMALVALLALGLVGGAVALSIWTRKQ